MSSVQSACLAHRNGGGNGFSDDVEISIDANGDLLNNDNGLKVTSSSEEDIASTSSKDDETDAIITLKTR